MRIFLILFSAAILIVFVQAQQKPKPVVNLAKRPRPIWNRPPEERRKLSIFPKKDMKFVVNPKIVKNDDEAKEGLPTKRPLMRKFVIRDKNETGTWSFAPREPLMKTQRFTVTLAPPKSNHHETSKEIPEESHRVQTVIRNTIKIDHENKAHNNINKGNLIEMVKINKNLSESRTLHKTEQNPTGEENLKTAKVNDTQDNQVVPMSSDKPLVTFGVDLIDVRSFNDDGVTLVSNETVNKDESKNTSINKTTDTLSSEVEKDFIKSRTLDLNEMKHLIDVEGNFTEPAAVTFIVSNLESVINFTENDTFSKQIITDTRASVGEDNAARHITARLTDRKVSNYFAYNTEDVLQTQSPETDKNNDTEDSSSQDLSLEIYESDMPLSNEDISTECYECGLTLDEISNKPISNLSSNEAEERSNESLMNEPTTLTNEESNESSLNAKSEQYSNELSSNMAGEEISNEFYLDKSNKLTEEISNESIVESSQSVTGEQFSNESSINVADDELFTEDILSESRVDSSDENILNESSIIFEEEISNVSYLTHAVSEESVEASYNSNEEVISNDSSLNRAGEGISNESHTIENDSEENIESFSNFTNEEIPLDLIENSENISDERRPEEFAANSQEANTEKIAVEALINRYKRSNNIIEEESLPTTVSGFKYSGHKDRLNHDLSYKNINA